MDRLGGLVVIASARRAGDLGSNPDPGEENTYVGITLIRGFYVNDTYRQVLKKI